MLFIDDLFLLDQLHTVSKSARQDETNEMVRPDEHEGN